MDDDGHRAEKQPQQQGKSNRAARIENNNNVNRPAQTLATTSGPPHWPKSCGVRYLHQYHWDPRVPHDVVQAHKGSRQLAPSGHISHFVRIARIEGPPEHPAKGQWGLFAAKTIPPQTLVCDYIGHILLDQHAETSSHYKLRFAPGLLCDAKQTGNEARFVNDFHGISPFPNVRFKTYTTEHGETRVGLFSQKRKIKKGSEITTDYGWKYDLTA